ncbi:glycine--tRNA ligase subunit beta [Cognatiyoonia sp. IB215182]|uniref:glycine--tRNA ligase subunit beta n=1 Tax=Cognatiyoonia sp. IB215182 TaxID=3097353 RepID=UPI002A0EF785|nr:glycine--tRNA ligase subunit beta [Cognatiyoonia sp. IB215182]MDX8351355.1 glycine--tRNA ligase subunit beta [Cognatiyoonia sp. IB215182]
MPDLLIELFSEEIPARMQRRAAEDLQKLVTDGLVEAGLTYAGAAAFSTPRRLTLAIDELTAESKPVREERRGPKVGAPDKAVEGFLRGAGVARDDLEVRDDKKGQVYFAVIKKPGRKAADIIAEVLETTIRNFPWPKSMRWGAGPLKWVRPLHSILCILVDEAGAEIVPLEVDGIRSGNTTQGHRFISKGVISVASFDDYEVKLKRAHVILRADERAEAIWAEATNQAFALGLELVEDRGLLAEVAGLVEWPVVLLGKIDDDFLGLPPEVLQTSMKEHQKFFSVKNPKTGRIERFVTVANMETADNGATILAGNQKVLSARLADAKFFWENDLRTVKTKGLEGMGAPLADVTFHNKLGSQADRVKRIEALAREIAPHVGAKPDLAAEAARICKSDLASEMVYEFPELQGLMGRYYAEAAGHDDGVPEACEEHYSPLGPSDDVPTAPVSVAVALADKIDTLTGFWAIDEKPTGSKDPFALRRAALGVIRLVLENDIRLRLDSLLKRPFLSMASIATEYTYDGRAVIENAVEAGADDQEESDQAVKELVAGPSSFVFNFDGLSDRFVSEVKSFRNTSQKDEFDFREYDSMRQRCRVVEYLDASSDLDELPDFVLESVSWISQNLLSFFHDRLKVFLREKGIRHDIIDACIAMPGNDDLTLLVKRADALATTLATDDGENLIQGFKRANNILTQAEEADGVEYSYGADPKFAEEPAEKALFAALDAADAKIAPAMEAEDFSTAMTAMAALRGPIDQFFTDVQVNAESAVLRRNRLNLLSRIRKICLSVADLTKIEG